jgi:hypothetical protein
MNDTGLYEFITATAIERITGTAVETEWLTIRVSIFYLSPIVNSLIG